MKKLFALVAFTSLSAFADCNLSTRVLQNKVYSSKTELNLKEFLNLSPDCNGVPLERLEVTARGGGTVELSVNGRSYSNPTIIDSNRARSLNLYFPDGLTVLDLNRQEIELTVYPYGGREISIESVGFRIAR